MLKWDDDVDFVTISQTSLKSSQSQPEWPFKKADQAIKKCIVNIHLYKHKDR